MGTVKRGGKTFGAELNRTLAYEFSGTIEELLDELKDQEKRFLQNQSGNELERYKALLQTIIKSLLDDGLKEKTLKRKKKNWGDFVIIEKINARLLELTEAITKGNRAFNLLKTMEEIRGLVLDLVY